MTTVYLPVFYAEDFEAIKGLLGPDMTDTNEDWRKLIKDRVHQITRDGDQAVAVNIHPDELATILVTHRHHGALQVLDIIARLKGEAGQRD